MRVERKFYSEAKKLQTFILQKIKEEKLASTAEMKAAERAQRREESQRLYSIYRETARSDPRPRRVIKWPQFCRLVDKALWMAERCSLDIWAEDLIGGHGRIRLETAYFALLENADPALQGVWLELYKNSTEMTISHKRETLLIELWYSLQN